MTLVNPIELVAQELQNRIGQITSQYETQMAVLKAQIAGELQARDDRIAELEKQLGVSADENDSE